MANEIAERPELEPQVRRVAGALYHVTSAIILAWEATRLDGAAATARLELSELVLQHRLEASDPLACEPEQTNAVERLLETPLG